MAREQKPDEAETVHTSSFWDDLNRRMMASPRFQRGYQEQTQRLAEAGDAAPQQPRSGFWRRFWRTLTRRRDVVPAAALDAKDAPQQPAQPCPSPAVSDETKGES